MKVFPGLVLIISLALGLAACRPQANAQPPADTTGKLNVLATESFLADLTRNVAGERAVVDALIPLGLDPHAFEPTPRDVGRITESEVLILNGAGFEEWLDETISNAGGRRLLVEASSGLTPRTPQPNEAAHAPGDEHAGEVDAHFWFDPLLTIRYVENIRDGLIQADPDGAEIYTANAQAYIDSLNELDAWTTQQIAQIPPERRLLVTNHESFGYFADRYGLQIVGAVLPSVSTSASPSAKQMSELIEKIRSSGASAIFLETGANPELAQQISQETGAQIVTGLFTHSLSEPDGPASNYLEMMRYNTGLIVSALK
jgi:ABC-type Zn uptake system ZnuABC Zn-binding protein ZnuA